MKFNFAQKLQDSEMQHLDHAATIDGVRYEAARKMVNLLPVTSRHVANEPTPGVMPLTAQPPYDELRVTVFMFGDERMHEILRAIETLHLNLMHSGKSRHAEGLQQIVGMLTSSEL